jgi:beta-galactosidase
VFRAVSELGARLRSLAPTAGSSRHPAQAAIVFDWESWWASEQDSHPSSMLRYKREALDWYSAFLALGVRADVVPVAAPLDGYRFVVAPILHVVPAPLAARLSAYVDGGGHLVTTYFSGVVDEHDHVWPGGYPGALRELLGIRIEEFGPLPDGDEVALDDGSTGSLWTDRIDVTASDVDVLARYKTGEYAGRPAVTRRPVGSGSASYVSTRLGPVGLRPSLSTLLDAARVRSELPESLRGRVELAIRTAGETRFWFLVNRTDDPVELAELGRGVLGPREVVVLDSPLPDDSRQ